MERNRTLEDYKRAGAYMRLLKDLLSKTHVECSNVLTAQDYDQFNTAEKVLNRLSSRAEDNMFNDFPKLGGEYTSIFYGTIDANPIGDVDKEQMALAIKLIKELFELGE